MDGANFNALVGVARPGDWGVDVMHFNLHKTFSTPHGGGGPGSGPVGVSEKLAPYLPVPRIAFDGKRYYLSYDAPKSIGRLLGFHGHFLVWLKALAYILTYGRCIDQVANGLFRDPYPSPCMHEFVLSAANLLRYGISAADVAKRLLDYGFYAPTVYFPLIVREALMIEPTETENPDTLRRFAKALENIVREAPPGEGSQERPELRNNLLVVRLLSYFRNELFVSYPAFPVDYENCPCQYPLEGSFGYEDPELFHVSVSEVGSNRQVLHIIAFTESLFSKGKVHGNHGYIDTVPEGRNHLVELTGFRFADRRIQRGNGYYKLDPPLGTPNPLFLKVLCNHHSLRR